MSIPLEVSESLHIAGLENRIAQLEQRNSGLEAARIAYANELPLSSDGEPDVGSIHQNIRKLKADYAKLEADLAAEKEMSQVKDDAIENYASAVKSYQDQLAEARKFERSLRDIQSLLTDDKFASMFQSLGQYRKTIFETVGAAIAAIKEQGK